MPYGTEVEYPTAQSGEETTTFTKPAYGSHDLTSEVRNDYGGAQGWPDGEIGSDPTAGIELRSDPMSNRELKQWYREAIVELSKYRPHEPCGISANSRASTIGLHLHFSGEGWTEQKARGLYELSTEPWFKLFACSSLTEGTTNSYQVFRGNYCGMSYSDRPSNDCVNRAERHADHWEWRLLEPVTPDHFDVVMSFMDIVQEQGVDRGREFAQSLVDDLDPVLTSVKRAKALGIKDKLEEYQTNVEQDTSVVEVNNVNRNAANHETRDFFRHAYSESHAPYIYTVETELGDYYAMVSHNYSEDDDPFVVNDVEFNHDSVLDARDLTEVTDEDLASEIRQQARTYRNLGHIEGGNNRMFDGFQRSDATDALIERLQAASNGGSN